MLASTSTPHLPNWPALPQGKRATWKQWLRTMDSWGTPVCYSQTAPKSHQWQKLSVQDATEDTSPIPAIHNKPSKLMAQWLSEDNFRRQIFHLQRLTLTEEDVPKFTMGFLGFLLHGLETGLLGNSVKIFLIQGELKEGSNLFHSQYWVLAKGTQHKGEVKRLGTMARLQSQHPVMSPRNSKVCHRGGTYTWWPPVQGLFFSLKATEWDETPSTNRQACSPPKPPWANPGAKESSSGKRALLKGQTGLTQ